jgi:hypothetical protein
VATPTEVERAWAVLQPPRHAQLAAFPIGPDLGATSCRLAVDQDGLRHLIVPATSEQVAVDPRPSALTVTVRQLTFDGLKTVWVDVCCTDGDLNPEFDELINDVLENLDGSSTPAATTLRTINRWRRLFGAKATRGLSVQARRGLFAELMLLRTLLTCQPTVDVSAWTGPLRQPHDFELPRRCIEVKAVGRRNDAVTIHGLDQLASHDGRPLDLVVMTVVDDPAGATLAEIIDEIKTMTPNLPALATLLRDSGWTPMIGAADTDRLSVSDVISVVVDDTLPRLVPNSLTAGTLPTEISELTYKLSREAVDDRGQHVTLDELIGRAA